VTARESSLITARLTAATSAYDTTPEQQRTAAALVHVHAANPADEEFLLSVLGLTPQDTQ
jgi:hypothetical protein